jgi:hypothetical protein
MTSTDDDRRMGRSEDQTMSEPRILPPPPEERPDFFGELRDSRHADIEEMRARMSAEDLQVVDRSTKALLDLRGVILEASSGYGRMLEADNFSDAWAWLEMTALAWRDTEEFDLEHAFDDDFLPIEAASLLGAIEDSFVLARSESEQHRELALEWSEVVVRTQQAGEAGLLGVGWNRAVDEVYSQSERTRATKRSIEEAYKKRRRKQVGLRARVQRGMTPRHRALQLPALLDDTAVPLAAFYRQLDPDGRPASEDERAEGHRHIEEAAAALRGIDIKRDLYDQGIYGTHILPFVSMIRATMRSLVLALSEEPERRARAAPLLEIQQRWNRHNAEAKAGRPTA